ncbi:hypothetical protein [Prescottella agglutinans]|uniref:hypothetical protein n=1 Tax=Prescottella agglutinans TaxID=1644129 RepID=UPI002475674B|nr:hypothetical protein [Prescottella agglutinans]
MPDRGWDFTVYEYGDGAPEAITGGSRATFNDAVAAGSDAIERLQALDLEQPPADERDSVGNLKVKHESLRQRRIRVAELAVGVARIELREIKTRPGEGYAAIARARLAVERAKLEVETIKAESTEITHVTVQDPDAAMAALKKHSEALADQRGRTRRRRSGGR